MRAILVDDEIDGVKTMKKMLHNFCENVNIVGEANSALEAIKLINKELPDVVFLDVEMPHGNGFDVLEATKDKNYHTIFTTAYNHYALKALKSNAVDYLLKPIDIDELKEAVEKVCKKSSSDTKELNFNLLNTFNNDQIKKIAIPSKDGYYFVDVDEILYVKGEGSYVEIHTKNKTYVSSKNLKHYGEIFENLDFYRANKSFIVNKSKISKYIRENGGMIVMQDQQKVLISRAKRVELKDILGI